MATEKANDGRYTGLRVTELNFGAGLTIWSFRACATGHGHCPPVVDGMNRALGLDGDEGRVQCLAMAQTLAEFGQRTIRISQPGCLGVTYDELVLVAAFEAAQNHNFNQCNALLTWLLGRSPDTDVSDAVLKLARLFKCAGHMVRQPTDWRHESGKGLASKTYARLLGIGKGGSHVHSIQK